MMPANTLRARCLAIATAAAVSAGNLDARPPAIEDLFSLPNLLDVSLSPNDETVAWVISRPDFEANDHVAEIWLATIRDHDANRSWRLDLPDSAGIGNGLGASLAWTPDSGELCWVGRSAQGSQVYCAATRPDTPGSPPRAVTASPTPVRAWRWSPDGRFLAYLAAAPDPEETAQRKAEQRFYSRSDRPDPPVSLWIAGPPGKPDRLITPGTDHVSDFDWSPDSQALVYAASAGSDFMATFNAALYLVEADGTGRRLLVPGPGMKSAPRWSPNGGQIAFLNNWGDQTITTNAGVALVAPESGDVVPLTRELDRSIGELEWHASGESLLVIAPGGLDRKGPMGASMFETQLYRIDVRGSSAGITALTSGAHTVSHLSPGGDRLAYKVSGGGSTGDVWVAGADGSRPGRVTELSDSTGAVDWIDSEPVTWNGDDGYPLWGLLVRPPGSGKGPFPLVVYVHGGPVGGFTYGIYPQFTHTIAQVGPYPVQALAAAGIGVFLPMPRGGNGYGSEGLKAIFGNWGVVDYRDIMSGVDALVGRGLADPDRLGVAGGSYGGYMTNWIVTQTDRFRAASSWAGVCDIASLYALSDAGDFTLAYFGTPWENPDTYTRHSPRTFLHQMNTPLLLQHGAADGRVPTSEAITCHKILAAQGKPATLEIYPRAGHVPFEPRMQYELQARNLEWFTGHLLD